MQTELANAHILHEQVKCRKSGICQEMNARYDDGDVMR
jgi:hypothetical protein